MAQQNETTEKVVTKYDKKSRSARSGKQRIKEIRR